MILLKSIHLLFLVLAILAAPAVGHANLNVVAATPDLGSIAEAVGGERVKVTSLARGTEDPHFVAPRPSFIPILNRADVLIEGGAELEVGWLPPLVQTARNRAIFPGARGHIAVARYIELQDVPTGPIDRSMGDVHGGGNPHFMLDPENGRIAARVIAERFAHLDPEGAEVYQRNLERFSDRLDLHLKQWQEKLAPFEGTKVVSYHKNYNYLARRFGFIIFAEIEPLPGIEPTPRHLAGLISSMRNADVSMIWMEPFRPRRTPARVAEQTGATLVFLPELVGAVEGTEDYIALIDYNVTQILKGMGEDAAGRRRQN
jgi:zinc/manganese transport system substrate-binding protein